MFMTYFNFLMTVFFRKLRVGSGRIKIRNTGQNLIVNREKLFKNLHKSAFLLCNFMRSGCRSGTMKTGSTSDKSDSLRPPDGVGMRSALVSLYSWWSSGTEPAHLWRGRGCQTLEVAYPILSSPSVLLSRHFCLEPEPTQFGPSQLRDLGRHHCMLISIRFGGRFEALILIRIHSIQAFYKLGNKSEFKI